MLPKEIVKQMIENDAFSKWLGLEILEMYQLSCLVGKKFLSFVFLVI